MLHVGVEALERVVAERRELGHQQIARLLVFSVAQQRHDFIAEIVHEGLDVGDVGFEQFLVLVAGDQLLVVLQLHVDLADAAPEPLLKRVHFHLVGVEEERVDVDPRFHEDLADFAQRLDPWLSAFVDLPDALGSLVGDKQADKTNQQQGKNGNADHHEDAVRDGEVFHSYSSIRNVGCEVPLKRPPRHGATTFHVFAKGMVSLSPPPGGAPGDAADGLGFAGPAETPRLFIHATVEIEGRLLNQ